MFLFCVPKFRCIFYTSSTKKLYSSFTTSPQSSKTTNLESLTLKLSKHNVPDLYEKHLSNHISPSRLIKRAAVLIPISIRSEVDENGDSIDRTYFTLSKRTDLMNSHKGEVCFLGGKKDSEWESDIETAYREAREEANLDPKSLTFLAQLCPLMSYQRILVTPVIAFFDKTNFQPVLNANEAIR